MQHGVDVIENLPHLPGAIHGVKPDRLAIKYQAGHVGENAGAEASSLGQMHGIANFASGPFLFVDVHGHFGIAAIGAATAAAGEAIGQMRAVLHDIQRAPICADHALPIRAHISSTGIR